MTEIEVSVARFLVRLMYHLSIDGNYTLAGRDGTTVSTIEYQFEDVSSGSEIAIEISEELATQIGLTMTTLKIIVE